MAKAKPTAQQSDYPAPDSAPTILRYGGRWWPTWQRRSPADNPIAGPCEDWEIEMACCQRAKDSPGPRLWGKPLSKQEDFEFHFKRLVTIFFGPDSGSSWRFDWNPNADKMLNCILGHKNLGILGHASSGKTMMTAVLGVTLFMIFGENIKVLVTSVTIEAAKSKIWAQIHNAWNALAHFFGGEDQLPGKYLAGSNTIRCQIGGESQDDAGIQLVPSDSKGEKTSAGKIQGIKVKGGFLLVLVDEMDLLGDALFETIMSNLSSNELLRFVGQFNPSTRFNAAGRFVTQRGGWKPKGHPDHISEDGPYEWRCEGGTYALRFDGLKSPNAKKSRGDRGYHEGLLDQDRIEDIASKSGGENSPKFWQQVRGWFCPDNATVGVYSEEELVNYGAAIGESGWIEPPIFIAGLDVGRNHGGDACVLVILRVGTVQMQVAEGERLFDPATFTGKIFRVDRKVCEVVEVIPLDRDMKVWVSKEEQLVTRLKEILDDPRYNGTDPRCQALKIGNIAVDVTGGAQVLPLIKRDIGLPIEVNFKSSASDKRMSLTDHRKGEDVFANKRAQMWWCRDLVRCRQLKGLKSVIIAQMCEVKQKETANGRILLEDKEELAKRLGKSPDEADGFFLGVEVAREKFGLTSHEHAIKKATEGYEIIEKMDLNGKPIQFEIKKPTPYDPYGFAEWGKNKGGRIIIRAQPVQFLELPNQGGLWGKSVR